MNELANLIIEKVNIEKYLYLIALTLARPNNPRDCNNHASRTSKWFFIIYFSMNHRGAWQRRCWPLLSSWILWLPHFDQCRGVFFRIRIKSLEHLKTEKFKNNFTCYHAMITVCMYNTLNITKTIWYHTTLANRWSLLVVDGEHLFFLLYEIFIRIQLWQLQVTIF